VFVIIIWVLRDGLHSLEVTIEGLKVHSDRVTIEVYSSDQMYS